MRLSLLKQMQCPYSGSAFTVSANVEGDSERIHYGLVRSACFEFPIIEGILLLSLAKGYGGAEEELQPGAPLQIAAIEYLQRGDVAGLKRWIARHAPVLSQLLGTGYASYIDFAVDYDLKLQPASQRHLVRAADFEVVGDLNGRRRVARALHLPETSAVVGLAHRALGATRNLRMKRKAQSSPAAFRAEQLHRYYTQRFFCVRANATAIGLRHLRMDGRILSVCSGHGVFENLLRVMQRQPRELVCMDGQLINLLVVRRIIGADADLICHDVQFGWPYADGMFDGVFSSTCLPEIPTQRHFLREASRVAAASGWTLFDSIWAEESGVHRIDPYRYYRFCQNFLEHIREYVPMFSRCLPEKQTGIDVSGTPSEYLGGPAWSFDATAVARALQQPRDVELSALVIDAAHFAGFVPEPSLDWISAERLAFSPAFELQEESTCILLRRRREYARPDSNFASRGFGALPETVEVQRADLRQPERVRELFCSGVAVPVPPKFAPGQRMLASYAT